MSTGPHLSKPHSRPAPKPGCFHNPYRPLALRCLPSLVSLAVFFFFSFLTVRKVAKTEAHLQATLRPEREREEALRALPLEGRQGEHVLAEVCRHVCGMWWVGSTVLRTFSLTAIFVQ